MVWGVGCGVWGVGCGVWGVGCGAWGVVIGGLGRGGGKETSPSMAQMIFRQSLVLVLGFGIQVSVFGFWSYPWSGAPHALFSLPPLSPSAPTILALVTRSAQTARALSIHAVVGLMLRVKRAHIRWVHQFVKPGPFSAAESTDVNRILSISR